MHVGTIVEVKDFRRPENQLQLTIDFEKLLELEKTSAQITKRYQG
jgi:hypothetical protein